ncbi:hypothetical protein ACQZ6S_14720 [Agrobacterium tumefaciens]
MRRNEVSSELKDLGFDFLYYFVRFEFALKVNGYLKKPKPGQPAEARWKSFQDCWEAKYKITESARTLIEANLKKQIVGKEGLLLFSPIVFPEGTSQFGQAIRLCQTVRNNLFHGGKSSKDGSMIIRERRCSFRPF